jgi:predicted enzyme related to lactoylglutathione lyase
MALVWEQVVVDSRDPRSLGRWWAEALGWEITYDTADEVEIRRRSDEVPGLLFVAVRGAKTGKNRLHLDFRPDDQALEVDRLVALGAHRVDVGQVDVGWVVLADPEGNEFCVLGRSEPS